MGFPTHDLIDWYQHRAGSILTLQLYQNLFLAASLFIASCPGSYSENVLVSLILGATVIPTVHPSHTGRVELGKISLEP